MVLELHDPLAHRALAALMKAEVRVLRRLRVELARRGISATGFHILVLLTSAGGRLELRTLRARLGLSKATVSETLGTLEERGLVERRRLPTNRRAAVVIQAEAGRRVVEELFPEHSGRVSEAFAGLDEDEKRELTSLCRKLAA